MADQSCGCPARISTLDAALLSHVELLERLTSCALVSWSWRAAVAESLLGSGPLQVDLDRMAARYGNWDETSHSSSVRSFLSKYAYRFTHVQLEAHRHSLQAMWELLQQHVMRQAAGRFATGAVLLSRSH